MVRRSKEQQVDTGIFWGAVGIGVTTVLLTFGLAAYHTYVQVEGSGALSTAAKTPIVEQAD